MGHEKSRNRTTRFRQADDDALDAVAGALGMERSDAIRFLIHEKARALGVVAAPVRGAPVGPPTAAELAPDPAVTPPARPRRTVR
jgi:hypothetical protein